MGADGHLSSMVEVSLPASLGGLPTISLPLPSREPELAAGIQFMASSGRDTEFLHIAWL
ncbi:MAG: hypothetical protein CM15mP84_05240 [Cellvibrionales bacterium]|nr:MAG: hypothetical protein CM15mP84_05240 [Cellvibrionales bacterium]